MSSRSIAIFDSGLGGLTVVRALKTLLPQEPLLYFADTLSRPFGIKSSEELSLILKKNCELISSFPIKILLIACHTACSLGLEPFHSIKTPVIPIFPTALENLNHLSHLNSCIILGTNRTIASGMYQTYLHKHHPHLKAHYIAASPIEHLIETQCNDALVIEHTLRTLLSPLGTCDALFLACTHFPIYQSFIRKIIGPQTLIIDPAISFSQHVYHLLKNSSLLHPEEFPPGDHYMISKDPERFKENFLYYFEQSLGKTNCKFHNSHAIL